MTKELLFFITIIVFNACSTIKAQNDVACLSKVNTIVSKEINKEFKSEDDSWKGEAKLFMKFYVNETGHADSIVFANSNLSNLGIDEDKLRNNLMNYEYQCIRDVYYSSQLKPDFVVITFNPNLVE